MQATEPLYAVFPAAFAGLAMSVALERFLRPTPDFFRPAQAWGFHVGIWCCAYGLCAALLGHPWLAAGCILIVFFILILVNNAKMHLLQEPFIFQDYEYFLDAIQFPRLYLPFFGWEKFLAAAAGILLFLWAANALLMINPYKWSDVLGGAGWFVCAGILCLYLAARRSASVSFDPGQDIRIWGLLSCLWHYGRASRLLPVVESPFASSDSSNMAAIQQNSGHIRTPDQKKLPHLLAVQSESFFDPRTAFPDIRSDVLSEYDTLKTEATAWGKLRVPAWGANTVRTEFAFLSGIENSLLGAHRFNPYRAVARGWRVPSLASLLRSLGYRTVCAHPYHRAFYLRERVLPRLDFEEFWDISAFADAQRSGPYISDMSVAEKALDALEKTDKPLFLFVITMENHGPLHLERVASADIAELYARPPDIHCADLTVYLRHLRNADAMIGRLRSGLERLEHPAELCWYGDHVPIMPKAYATHGTPPGEVEYVFWSARKKGESRQCDLAAHALALAWRRSSGCSFAGG